MKVVTKEYQGFTFVELDDKAKDRVRSWYCEDMPDWDEFVKDDFEKIAALMGVTVDNIYYSGFWSQGDGAMFEGSYCYMPGSVAKIKEYAPNDLELHRIATELRNLQRKYFYGLSANIKHRGHYSHSGSNTISIDNCYTYQEVTRETEDDLATLLRDLMDWLYDALAKEYEYLTSDESIKESCEANEYYFTKHGKLI